MLKVVYLCKLISLAFDLSRQGTQTLISDHERSMYNPHYTTGYENQHTKGNNYDKSILNNEISGAYKVRE
jgi:hypothetical protein